MEPRAQRRPAPNGTVGHLGGVAPTRPRPTKPHMGGAMRPAFNEDPRPTEHLEGGVVRPAPNEVRRRSHDPADPRTHHFSPLKITSFAIFPSDSQYEAEENRPVLRALTSPFRQGLSCR